MNDTLKPFADVVAVLSSDLPDCHKLFWMNHQTITVGDLRRLVAGVTPHDPAYTDMAQLTATLRERSAPLLQDANAELLSQIHELQGIINGLEAELQALRREYADQSDALATCQGDLDGFIHGGP